jgi:outer membrane protein
MRKALALAALGLALVMYSALDVGAADTKASAGPKIGWVDLQRTLQETKAGKKAKEKLENEKGDKQKEVDKKKDAFKKKVEELNKQRVVMKADAFEAKRAELEQEYLGLQEEFMKMQQDLVKKEAMLTQEIFIQAAGIIDSIAKRDGYTVILEKTESALLYAYPAGEITNEVNSRLDKGEGAKGGGKGK